MFVVGFYAASQFIRPNTKPDAIFKTTPREPFGRLTQTLTGHGYTGEYYHRFHINDHPHECDCPLPGPILQTRDHIIRECPNFENGRSILRKKFPRLENPKFQLASILKRDNLPTLLKWMKRSGAFTKKGIPWDDKPP